MGTSDDPSKVTDNKSAHGTFLETRKAFDTVDHKMLIKNWSFMGGGASELD